jgi:hypothetical protein
MSRSTVVTATKRQQRESVLEESRALAVLLRWEALLDVAGDLALPQEPPRGDASFADAGALHA